MVRMTRLGMVTAGLLRDLENEPTLAVLRKVAPGAECTSGFPASGVALRYTPRLTPHRVVKDWLMVQAEAADKLPEVLENDISIVVHWPTFLKHSFGHLDDFGKRSRRMWMLLRPFFRVSSPVLYEYIGRYERLFGDYPLQNDELLESMNWHIEVLLKSAFGRRAISALKAALKPLWDTPASDKLGRCYACLNQEVELASKGLSVREDIRKYTPCPACNARDALVRESAVIDPVHVMGDSGLKHVRNLADHMPYQQPEPGFRVAADLAWMLDGLTPYDGAASTGGNSSQVVVYWVNYLDRVIDSIRSMHETEREPALRNRTSLSYTAHKGAFDVLLELRAVTPEQARDARARLLDALKTTVLHHAGTPLSNNLETDETTFTRAQLKKGLEAATSPAKQTRLRKLRDAAQNIPRHGQRKRTVYTAQYPVGGGHVAVQFKRHAESFQVKTPLMMPEGVVLPAAVRRQIESQPREFEYWWKLPELMSYATRCLGHGLDNAYSAITNLHAWCVDQVVLFKSDPAQLRVLRQNETLDQRIQAKAAALAAGDEDSAAQLGRFTVREKETLATFLHSRDATPCEASFRGPFTESEWTRLEAVVPFRSRDLLITKINELGFDYALEHGYVKYLRSGFCISKSSSRRYQWMRRGVKL